MSPIDRVIDYLQLISEQLNWFATQPLLVVLLFVYLIGATYTDIKSLKVYDKYNLTFFIVFTTYIVLAQFDSIPIDSLSIWVHILGMVVSFFALLIPAMILMHKMGGDIKLVTVIGYVIGLPLFFPFFVITCLVGLIYGGTRKFILKKPVMKFPFAPFFLSSFIILSVITIFI